MPKIVICTNYFFFGIISLNIAVCVVISHKRNSGFNRWDHFCFQSNFPNKTLVWFQLQKRKKKKKAKYPQSLGLTDKITTPWSARSFWTVSSVSRGSDQRPLNVSGTRRFPKRLKPKGKVKHFIYSNIDKFSGNLLLGKRFPGKGAFRMTAQLSQPSITQSTFDWNRIKVTKQNWQDMENNTAEKSSVHILSNLQRNY